MDTDKRNNKKNENKKYFYIGGILLVILLIGILLIFLLPKVLANSKQVVIRGRVISGNDITDTTSMDVDGSLSFTYEYEGDIKEVVKISTTTPNYDIGDYSNPKYIYHAYSGGDFYLDVEVTITGLSYKSIEFTLSECDEDGTNVRKIEGVDVVASKARCLVSGGEIYLSTLEYRYQVI